jgi:hypothetical protein
LVEAAITRQDDLRQAESRRLEDLVAIRAFYDAELRKAESARIDAIRGIDTAAVTRSTEVSAQQAETLRAQVEATRIAAAETLAAALEPIKSDISDLRRIQYEQQGQRSAVVEHRSVSTDARTLILGILVALAGIAAVISPHIH